MSDRLRNIGIIAHINAGKTTLTECILYATGKQRYIGEVDDGTATMDFLAEEQSRGISIHAAFTTVPWKGYRLTLIDTPGHVDFTAEVERCLRVLDGVVVLLDGVKGVESQTETVWRQAAAWGIPRLIFVNKMDRAGADFLECVDSVAAQLGCRPVPLVYPICKDGQLIGLVDAAGMRARRCGDAELPPPPPQWRVAVAEACADIDEVVMADFIENREIDAQRLHAALRRGTLENRLVPVIGGSALRNVGVDALLDAVCRYLPSPQDMPPVVSLDESGAKRPPSVTAPICALIFKTMFDGDDRYYCARVYSGSLLPGDVLECHGFEPFVVDKIWSMHADCREPMDQASAGEVVALETTARLRTGDTLFAVGHPMRLEPAHFPRPVLSVALEPRSPADTQPLARAARALAADDPTLIVERDREAARWMVSGMGELHLEVFGSRLRRRVGERVRFAKPTVAYRETVRGRGRATAETRPPGGGAARAVVTVAVEARPGQGFAEVVNEVAGSRGELLASALRARLQSGLAAPYPATDLVLELLEVQGEPAGEEGDALFLDALAVACRKAVAAAEPVLLEPLMQVAVQCPADTLSGVLADLRSRHARIESVESGFGPSEVTGTVTLAAVLGYATRLRSITRGLGVVSLTPRGMVPKDPSEGEKEHTDLDPPLADR